MRSAIQSLLGGGTWMVTACAPVFDVPPEPSGGSGDAEEMQGRCRGDAGKRAPHKRDTHLWGGECPRGAGAASLAVRRPMRSSREARDAPQAWKSEPRRGGRTLHVVVTRRLRRGDYAWVSLCGYILARIGTVVTRLLRGGATPVRSASAPSESAPHVCSGLARSREAAVGREGTGREAEGA